MELCVINNMTERNQNLCFNITGHLLNLKLSSVDFKKFWGRQFYLFISKADLFKNQDRAIETATCYSQYNRLDRYTQESSSTRNLHYQKHMF